MIETLLRRFVETKQRKLAVIILTSLTLLAVVWPAADAYTAAEKRVAAAQDELSQAQQDIQTLPRLTQELVEKKDELRKLENQTVTEPIAQRLREDLTQLVRDTGCMMSSIKLDDSSTRVWMEEDDAISGRRRVDRGQETPFELVTWQLSVTITGPMAGIHQFLSGIHRINKLVHTKTVSMRRSANEENKTVLQLDLLLFNLARKGKS